jgi:hypothetical protein
VEQGKTDARNGYEVIGQLNPQNTQRLPHLSFYRFDRNVELFGNFAVLECFKAA